MLFLHSVLRKLTVGYAGHYMKLWLLKTLVKMRYRNEQSIGRNFTYGCNVKPQLHITVSGVSKVCEAIVEHIWAKYRGREAGYALKSF